MTIGILEQRRIEAGVIKPIFERIRAEFGIEVARRIIGEAIREATLEAAQKFAQASGGEPTLRSFEALLPLWTQGGALEIEVLESTDARFSYNVTRCRYAEMYRELGLEEIGDLLSCNRDATFCQGYNPKIQLTRTQTIQGGAPFCDFRYRTEETEPVV